MRFVAAASLLAAVACSNATSVPAAKVPDSILLESPAFSRGGLIPDAYACEPYGKNLSPPLRWHQVPSDTIELALIMDDPTAKGFAHWVVYGIDPGISEVAFGQAPKGATVGTNDFGRIGYGGPCPSEGSVHRYVFTLYALRAHLGLPDGASKQDVIGSLDARATAKGTLIGMYSVQ